METFETSASIKEIATALGAFQAEIKNPKLNKTNPFFKKKYTDLAALWDCARDLLKKNQLSVCQIPHGENSVTTILMHESGEFIRGTLTLTPTDTSPQKCGSAITYAKRYQLAAMLGMAGEDDDDGNSASENPKAKSDTVQKFTPTQSAPPKQAIDDDAKPWLNELSEKTKEWLLQVRDHSDLKEIYKALRQKYKVSKKMEKKIETYILESGNEPAPIQTKSEFDDDIPF
jgi:hypothetical protein